MKRYWLTLALVAAGCFGPDENVLFERDDRASGGGAAPVTGGADSSVGARAGTDSGQNVAGASGGGAAANAGNGGAGSLGGTGGSGGDAPPSPNTQGCDTLPGAVVSPIDGHCYRVNESMLTFADARDACEVDGGYLVAIGSSEENDFTRDLHDGEHWLGATDQLADDVAGVGSYVWVNAEPWGYSDWDDGQPNAFETDCPDDADAACYEHCGFQTDEGGWKDRSCWHTIVSICEWDETGRRGATERTQARP
jgi:Lectin C-type domain